MSPHTQINPKTFSLCCVHSLLLQSIFFLCCQVYLLQQLLRYYLCLVLKAPHCFASAWWSRVPILHYFLPGALESVGLHAWGRGAISSPREQLAVSGDICDDHSGGEGGCYRHLTDGGQECFHTSTGQPLPQRMTQPQMSTAPRVRNPAFIQFISSFNCLYIFQTHSPSLLCP